MRGKQAPKRAAPIDPKFQNPLIGKLINYLMIGGKKTTAQKIVYEALDQVEAKMKKPAMEIFDEAMKNISPLLEVKAKRVGGANYQVPMQVRAERRVQLAYRWLLTAARSRKGKPMAEKLAFEIMEAAQNQGDAVKKKMDVQRMAEANRAFAHFAK
ncbi:30S ribosomal protein S7 [Candidatus Uhrbacteria bacterium]|jgi:small subunit ribosomal protein S7|nr:MAG: 30S ribosomal protein S7 [Candidatus Uhrbacteria bacterium]